MTDINSFVISAKRALGEDCEHVDEVALQFRKMTESALGIARTKLKSLKKEEISLKKEIRKLEMALGVRKPTLLRKGKKQVPTSILTRDVVAYASSAEHKEGFLVKNLKKHLKEECHFRTNKLFDDRLRNLLHRLTKSTSLDRLGRGEYKWVKSEKK